MPRRLCLLFLIVSLACCGWPALAHAHAVVFGASVDGDFNYYERGQWSWSQVQDSLRSLRATGATVARTGSEWAQTEPRAPRPGRPRYDWSHDNSIVRGLASAHLRWQPSLDYTPRWAQQPIQAARHGGLVSALPPADNRVYGAYVAAFARRYGVGGSFWRSHPDLPAEPVTTFEIWNEPDCRWTWGPDVNLEDYARLYAVAYRAIKRVDRRAAVITGGLAFTRSSLPRLLHALRGVPVDGLAVHPYGANAQATIAVARWTERQMAAAGRGRTPLIVNEYGWNSVPQSWQSISKRALPVNVRRSIVGLARVPHVSAIIPFEWSDDSWGLNDGGLLSGIRQVLGRR